MVGERYFHLCPFRRSRVCPHLGRGDGYKCCHFQNSCHHKTASKMHAAPWIFPKDVLISFLSVFICFICFYLFLSVLSVLSGWDGLDGSQIQRFRDSLNAPILRALTVLNNHVTFPTGRRPANCLSLRSRAIL